MDWLYIPVGKTGTERLNELGKRARGQMAGQRQRCSLWDREAKRSGERRTLRSHGQFCSVFILVLK